MSIHIYCLFEENTSIYIGKTKNSLNQRKNQHNKRLNKNLEIFELDYVQENEWKFWERFYIELFNLWGFNLLNQNKGGGGLSFHTKESLQKMKNKPHSGTSEKLKGKFRPDVSERLKGVPLDDKHCKNISKGKQGVIYSQERNNKIKTSNSKHYKKGSERNGKISSKLVGREASWVFTTLSKSVVMLDKNFNFIREFDSMSEAAKYINKNLSAISECCNKKRKSAYGYVWRFKEDYLNLKINK